MSGTGGYSAAVAYEAEIARDLRKYWLLVKKFTLK
jgi:hypothetical protein